LNIIQGRSNTGKTWILKCIYYLFSSDKRPFSPLTGYTDIEGVFETERYGTITISRKLDDTAKKKGIVDYIEEQVISLNGMKADYIKQLEALEGVDVKQRMQELNDCIKECQQDTNERCWLKRYDSLAAVCRKYKTCLSMDRFCFFTILSALL
jgi:hypothetical protein